MSTFLLQNMFTKRFNLVLTESFEILKTLLGWVRGGFYDIDILPSRVIGLY